MKRGAIVSTILIGLVGLLNIGCGGSPAVAPADTGMSAGPCPEWFANPPTDADHIYAASTATSRDLQMAMDKARTTGRLELASQIEVHIQGLTTKFAEEVGAGDDAVLLGKTSIATKQVVEPTLRGSRAAKTSQVKEGPSWRACVLMESPQNEADSNLVDVISKDEELYNRFRASQSFQELDNAIKDQREQEKGR